MNPPSGHGNPLPTRVVNVGNDNCHPKLVASNGKADTWLVLSYWGGEDSHFVFNNQTIHDLQSGIPPDDFPAAIRKVVINTRSHGIKYV